MKCREERGFQRTLINAKTGAVLTSLTATMLMFDMVEPIVEYGKGTNIVTSVAGTSLCF